MADNHGVPGTEPAQGGGAFPLPYFDLRTEHRPITFWPDLMGTEQMIKAVWRNETGAGACTQPDVVR